MDTLKDIDKVTLEMRAKVLSERREVLSTRVARLDDECRAVKRRLLPGIKSAVREVKDAEACLRDGVEMRPDLFAKPRTMTAWGIRFGWTKGKGKLVVASAQRAIELVRKHLPEWADRVIQTKESLVRSELAKLDVRDLRRIGADIEGAGDYVSIKATDSEVDKLVEALLGEEEDEGKDEG